MDEKVTLAEKKGTKFLYTVVKYCRPAWYSQGSQYAPILELFNLFSFISP